MSETQEHNPSSFKQNQIRHQGDPNPLLFVLGFSLTASLVFGLKSKALRRVFVKRNLVSTKNMNLSAKTRLSFIPRPTIFKEWNEFVNYSQQMVLIEGYEGTGKSFLFQKYIEELSNVRPTLYISLRDVNWENQEQVIGNQINFFPDMLVPSKYQYEDAPFCLKKAMKELRNSRWWFAPLASFSKKKRPIIVMDDIEFLFKKKTFEYKQLQAFIFNAILMPILDSNHAAIFLLTSDYSIEEELSILSGMSSRLTFLHFPEIEAKKFEDAMKKDFENLKKFNKNITLECLFKFYEEFNGDLRSLNNFILNYNGNYEETKSKLIQTEINRVAKYLNEPDEWKDECEILLFIFQNKKLGNELFLGQKLEVINRKHKALQNLIEEKIVRKTSTSISEFYSPKYALAIKKLLNK